MIFRKLEEVFAKVARPAGADLVSDTRRAGISGSGRP